jgi:tryptophan 2,3-dioxygenase
MLDVFESDQPSRAVLAELLDEPTLYDEFLRMLARAGFDVPSSVLERDVRLAHVFTPELVPVLLSIYQSPSEHWRFYEACEELVDLEDNFQLWRFRHLRTVQRTIGMKTGTGGSAGVAFLERALSLTFFPELYAVRNEIGA